MAIIFSSYIYTEATAGVTPQKVVAMQIPKLGSGKCSKQMEIGRGDYRCL